MHRLVAVFAVLAFALLPTTATGIGVINPVQHFEAAVSIAEYIVATEGCDGAFDRVYKKAKKRPLIDVMNDLWIAVVDIPDTGPGPDTAGATLPPIAPRVIILDDFWLTVRNPLDTAYTIVHEIVHLLDYSYLKEKEWMSLSSHEKEVRAEKLVKECQLAFFETHPEFYVGE